MPAPKSSVPCISRRRMLWQAGGGIAGLALCDILNSEQLLAARSASEPPLAPKQPHFTPKARSVISLFMNGGTSHVDTFDPKPQLSRLHGEAPPKSLNIETFFPYPGTFLKSPFTFRKYGQSGLDVSDLFPLTAESADDLAVIRSMNALSNNHNPAILQMMTGVIQPGRPSVGSWGVY